jgi:hypothetical protein
MPIDPNIALGLKAPQIESPMVHAARAAELSRANQQNMLGGMQMMELARANEQKNKMRDILSKVDPSASPEAVNKMLEQAYIGAGDISGLMAHRKTLAEAEAAQANVGKAKAQTEQAKASTAASEFDLTKKKIDHAWESVANSSTPETYRRNIEDSVTKKLITREQADQGLAELRRAEDMDMLRGGDTNFKQLRMSSLEKLLTAKDQLARTEPKYVFEDIGGKKLRIQTNPNAPDFDPKLLQLIKTPTIGEAETGRHNKVRESQDRERLNKETDPNTVAHVITDNAGNVTMINKKGQQVGPTLEGKGKPSSTYEKTAAQEKQLSRDRDMVISELEKAVQPGGLIDQSTGSGAGALYDTGARFFGSATKGDIAIGQLKPIADLAVKMVPRFEGPQSNADTASYTAAAGQLADPGLPREVRKAAGKEVLRLMKARKGQFQTQDMASGNVAAPNAAPPAGFVVDGQ